MPEHVSVLLNEVLAFARDAEANSIDGDFTVLDATLGLAGHSRAILQQCNVNFLYGYDQDAEARKIAERNLANFSGKFKIFPHNFSQIVELMDTPFFNGLNFILFDLGVSNLQLVEVERGFSFVNNGPLDMRMNQSNAKIRTAADILNGSSVKELTEIFRAFGEEKYAHNIAKAIDRKKQNGFVFKTTYELVDVIRQTLPQAIQRHSGGHPARRVFQALRIAVNCEMDVLKEALSSAFDLLRAHGILCVISYHSLEDRIVKNAMRVKEAECVGICKPRKAITPTENEMEKNYKSRSAKMRVFVRYDKTEEKEARENVMASFPY
ncbi:MAG: 16S rRNA (cytosine(1402)-N(4))-methyltransferase RsmH [Synergistaceae bacterium]|nr:16S rRNA (cytosine(1402)-N(4))-methyltransferase RsmH [Synergistaceae bacterium]